jgi:hypothetical protein
MPGNSPGTRSSLFLGRQGIHEADLALVTAD